MVWKTSVTKTKQNWMIESVQMCVCTGTTCPGRQELYIFLFLAWACCVLVCSVSLPLFFGGDSPETRNIFSCYHFVHPRGREWKAQDETITTWESEEFYFWNRHAIHIFHIICEKLVSFPNAEKRKQRTVRAEMPFPYYCPVIDPTAYLVKPFPWAIIWHTVQEGGQGKTNSFFWS